MKTPCTFCVPPSAFRVLSIVCLLHSALCLAVPVGTGFTYQGRLADSSNPAQGIYDFRFTIYDAASGGSAVAGPITNSPVTVSGGLFTTTLDFSSDIFTGDARWLEIGVRTNGGGADFTLLEPLQELTPTPYALYAPSAGTAATVSGPIAAGQITGAIASSNIAGGSILATHLASGSVTAAALAAGAVTSASLASNLTVAGTLSASRFDGNGALPWQTVAGAQQAAANTGYLLTNATQVTVTLPSSANAGDLVRVSGAGNGGWQVAGQIVGTAAGATWTPHESNRYWRSVASAADGTKLVAVVSGGQIYTSSDLGATWTPRETSQNWKSVASSADGTKLVAVVWGGGIYTSSDSGETWTPRESAQDWTSVASSADGTKLVAVVYPGPIYTSSDSGLTWTLHEIYQDWQAVASSADGAKLVAVVYGGQIYTSTNSGATWTPRGSHQDWWSVASSADGTKLVAVVDGGQIYTSTNSGVTWTPRETNRVWRSVASSADGARLVAVVYGGQIYISDDSGATWTPCESDRDWWSVAASADGVKLVAVAWAGPIYTSVQGLTGLAGTTLTLQHLGNGKWQPLAESQIAPSAVGSNQLAAGAVTSANLAAGAVTAEKIADGTIASPDVNTTSFNTTFWRAVGNAGTTAGPHFVGTTDDQPLEFKVNNQRALRIEPNSSQGPNVVGGAPVNYVAPGVVGVTIAGGGAGSYLGVASSNRAEAIFTAIGGGTWNTIGSGGGYGVIGGGNFNTITGSAGASTISGGSENLVSGASYAGIGAGQQNKVYASALGGWIGGGYRNAIGTNSGYAVVPGGRENVIGTNSWNAAIGGGQGNRIHDSAFYSTIAGGYDNEIQTNNRYNFIGGGNANDIGTNCNNATVAGGESNDIEANSWNTTIGGGSLNRILVGSLAATISGGNLNQVGQNADHATIAGGSENAISTNATGGIVGGGWQNTIAPEAMYAAILGGQGNRVLSNADYATIGGGINNEVGQNSYKSSILGGELNRIGGGGDGSVIGGGVQNTVASNSYQVVVGGGNLNAVMTNVSYAMIGGGYGNTIGPVAAGATIAGGRANEIRTNAGYAVVGGGLTNRVESSASYAAIGGGWGNTALVNGEFATIPGGRSNSATNYAMASGRRAKANHTGSFVWADATDADFASTGTNQFLIRASGGVGIGTNNPLGAMLNVAGTVRAVALAMNSTALATNLNADLLDGQSASSFWQLGGNSGTSPGTHFLGTTDNQALEIRASNVGIGTNAPRQKLHVNGQFLLVEGTAHEQAYLGGDGAGELDVQIGSLNANCSTLTLWNATRGGTMHLVASNVLANGDITLMNNTDVRLRNDNNHGVGWYGSGKPFAGASPDGPVVYGWTGGILGTKTGGEKSVVSWTKDQVTVNAKLSADNLPGLQYGQGATAPEFTDDNLEHRIDEISIHAPAAGYLSITAFLDITKLNGLGANIWLFFRLYDVTSTPVLLATATSDERTSSSGTLSLTWVLYVDSPKYVNLKTTAQAESGGTVYAGNHNLTAIYLPVRYQ